MNFNYVYIRLLEGVSQLPDTELLFFSVFLYVCFVLGSFYVSLIFSSALPNQLVISRRVVFISHIIGFFLIPRSLIWVFFASLLNMFMLPSTFLNLKM